jgi:hypothetical protein
MDTRLLADRLREGDRIQLIRPISGVEIGTEGTILYGFAFDSFYDVCFDGYGMPRLVSERNLTRALPDTSTA